MNRSLHYLSLLTLILFLSVSLIAQTNEHVPNAIVPTNTVQKEVQQKQAKEENETDGILQAMKQEVDMTKDPALGYVPRERLTKAMAYTQRLISRRSSIPGIVWTERGPLDVGGRTRAIMIDPNDSTHNSMFAAGVGGGLWKTTNIKATNPNWQPVNDMFADLAITTIAYDSTHPQTMYFGTGEGWYNIDAIRGNGIYKSADGGKTWNLLSSTGTSDFYYVQRLLVHPVTGDVYAATGNGIWRSKDGGNTWKVVLNSLTGAVVDPACDIQMASNHTLFAGMGMPARGVDGIYKSATGDSGTWVKKNTGTNGFPTSGFERLAIACAPSNSDYLYVMTQNFSDGLGGVYKSKDGGDNWTLTTTPTDADPNITTDITRHQAFYDLIDAVDPNDTATVIIGGVDLFKTTDGGVTWNQISHWYGGFTHQYVHADQHAILFQHGSSKVVYFGNDGGIWRSTTGGDTITDRDSNYRVTQFYACAINPLNGSNQMLAGAQDNGSHRFVRAGLNGGNEVTSGDGAFCHISATDPKNQFTSYVYSNFYYSNDSGKTFNSAPGNNDNGPFVNASDYDSKKDVLYAGNLPGHYLRWDTASNGGMFTLDTVPAFNGRTVTAVSVSPLISGRVFFGTRGGKVVRLDSAHSSSFTATDLTGGSMPTTAYVSCIALNPLNSNYMIVTYSNYGVQSVWSTIDGGTTWAAVNGNLPDMPVRWAMYVPGSLTHVLLATELGVWSTDTLNGTSTVWGTSNNGLANVRTDMLQYRRADNTIIAATHGRGLFSTEAFGVPKAAFSSATLFCDTATVAFTNNSIGASMFKWTFGDGDSSLLANPKHHYKTTGTYTVKLIASNANGLVDSVVKANYIVLNNPTSAIIAGAGGNKTACPGTAVTIGLAAKTGVSYQWRPASGLSSTTASNPSANPPTTTRYTLTAYDSGKCSIDTAMVVELTKVTPGITISVSPGKIICAGTPVTFTATIVNGGSTPTYQWKKNSANVGTNSATYTPGTLFDLDKIRCILTSSAGCVTNSTTRSNSDTIRVKPLPTVTTGGNKSICRGDSVALGAAPGAGFTYHWLPATGLLSDTVANPTSSATSTTTYTLTVTNNKTGCFNKDSLTLTVHPIDTPAVTITPSVSPVCVGTSYVLLTAVALHGGTVAVYKWMKNGTPVGKNANTYKDSVVNNGDILACRIISNAGCLAYDSVTSKADTIIIHPTPSVKITVQPSVICFGDSAVLKDTLSTTGLTLIWSPGAGLSSTLNNPVKASPSVTTVYTLAVSNSFGCVAKDSATLTIKPHVSLSGISGPSKLSLGSKGIYTADTKSATGYHWMVKGGVVNAGQGTDTVHVTWSTSGMGNIRVWADCSDTIILNVNVTTDTRTILVDARNVQVFPNPNSGQFTIELNTPDNAGKITVEVTNVLGEAVYTTSGWAVNNIYTKSVRLNPAVAGVYFVRITQNGISTVHRIVVQP